MKLSEAIRLGAMLKPQCRNVMLDANGTCALGAALEAIGTKYIEMGGDAAQAAWPELGTLRQACPSCGEPDSLYHIIGEHLNDKHRWTRERIADWLEGVEAAQAHVEPASTNAVRLEAEQPGVPLRV